MAGTPYPNEPMVRSGFTELAEHEDKAAISSLHRSWLRDINAGHTLALTRSGEAVRRIADDHEGAPDVIEVAADGYRAAGRFACTVEIEPAFPGKDPGDRAARTEGSGPIRRTERRALAADYVKTRYGWTIARIEFAA